MTGKHKAVISLNDTIIVLMGPSGSGKSRFIEAATLQNGGAVNHTLTPITSEVTAVRFPHPTTGKPYVLVDTPGFDEETKTDSDILAIIINWLRTSYGAEFKLAGIIYLYRISDRRICGSPAKNLSTFKKLLPGESGVGNVMLVTTMWNPHSPEKESREKELLNKYWSTMLTQGSKNTRFDNIFNSAWDVIDDLVVNGKDDGTSVPFREEWIDLRERVISFPGGTQLCDKLEKLLTEQQGLIRNLRLKSKEEKEIIQEYQQLEGEIQHTIGCMESMTKLPTMGRKIRMFFTFKRCTSSVASLYFPSDIAFIESQ